MYINNFILEIVDLKQNILQYVHSLL